MSAAGPAGEQEEKSPARSRHSRAAVADGWYVVRSQPRAGTAHLQYRTSERQEFDPKLSKPLQRVSPSCERWQPAVSGVTGENASECHSISAFFVRRDFVVSDKASEAGAGKQKHKRQPAPCQVSALCFDWNIVGWIKSGKRGSVPV